MLTNAISQPYINKLSWEIKKSLDYKKEQRCKQTIAAVPVRNLSVLIEESYGDAVKIMTYNVTFLHKLLENYSKWLFLSSALIPVTVDL